MSEEEIIQWEIMENDDKELAQIEQVPLSYEDKKLAKNQQFIKSVLENYEFNREMADGTTTIAKGDAESILKSIFDDANSVVTQNNSWQIIPDYKARAQIKLRILESMGIIKKNNVEVKVNFLNLLFNSEGN